MTTAGRATRDAYDAVADSYARLLPDVAGEAAVDRAVLGAFVEVAGRSGPGPVVEVGCGAGRITSHLTRAGLRVAGLDLSSGMVAAARHAHPSLALAVADAAALPIRTAALAGLVAWYSIIHLPPGALPAVVAEFARVTRRGAPVVVAFQCGDGERVDRTTSYGHDVALTYFRHSVDLVASSLTAVGLPVHAVVRREPVLAHETAPQAFVIAERR